MSASTPRGQALDISKLNHVTQSQWTGDYFLEYSEAGEHWYVSNDDLEDMATHDAIEALIEDWRRVDHDDESYSEFWRK